MDEFNDAEERLPQAIRFEPIESSEAEGEVPLWAASQLTVCPGTPQLVSVPPVEGAPSPYFVNFYRRPMFTFDEHQRPVRRLKQEKAALEKTLEGFWWSEVPGVLSEHGCPPVRVQIIRGPFTEKRDALRSAIGRDAAAPAPIVYDTTRRPNYNYKAHKDWIWEKEYFHAKALKKEIDRRGITEPNDIAEFKRGWKYQKEQKEATIPVPTSDALSLLSDNAVFNKVHPLEEVNYERDGEDNEKDWYPGERPNWNYRAGVDNKNEEEGRPAPTELALSGDVEGERIDPDDGLLLMLPEEDGDGGDAEASRTASSLRRRAAALLASPDPIPPDVLDKLGIPDAEETWISDAEETWRLRTGCDNETSIAVQRPLTPEDKQTAARRALTALGKPEWESSKDPETILQAHHALLENKAFDALRTIKVPASKVIWTVQGEGFLLRPKVVELEKRSVAPELPSPVPGLVLDKNWRLHKERDRTKRDHH